MLLIFVKGRHYNLQWKTCRIQHRRTIWKKRMTSVILLICIIFSFLIEYTFPGYLKHTILLFIRRITWPKRNEHKSPYGRPGINKRVCWPHSVNFDSLNRVIWLNGKRLPLSGFYHHGGRVILSIVSNIFWENT